MQNFFLVSDLGPWIALAVSVLIGTLIGLQRETARTQSSVGLRDMVLTSVLGWLSGRVDEPWFTAAVLIAVAATFIVRRINDPLRGITTELALISAFGLSFAISRPNGAELLPIAIALAIAVTFVLGAKEHVKTFIASSITPTEVSATVRFLALIFIIYPLLPNEQYGVYGFFNPRTLWLFVILATGVSFIGYFLRKFFGERKGMWMTGLVGGLVSTTVTTSSFASEVKRSPAHLREIWAAATASNAIQFARVFVLMFIVSPQIGQMLALPLLAACGAGFLLAFFVGRNATFQSGKTVQLENPMNLLPAFTFALYMSGIFLISSFAAAVYGSGALLVTSSFGALIDVDAVNLSAADLFARGIIDLRLVSTIVLIAIATNALVKIGITLANGSVGFFLRMLVSFAVMLGGFVSVWLLT